MIGSTLDFGHAYRQTHGLTSDLNEVLDILRDASRPSVRLKYTEQGPEGKEHSLVIVGLNSNEAYVVADGANANKVDLVKPSLGFVPASIRNIDELRDLCQAFVDSQPSNTQAKRPDAERLAEAV